MRDPADKLATQLADWKRRLEAVERSYQLGRSAFSDGTALADVQLGLNRAVENAAQAVKDSATALAKADGVVNTWYQESPPSGSGVGVGDFWVKTSTRAAYIRVQKTAGPPPTFEWVAVSDPDVAAALAAAQDAQAAADGKISTWFQNNPPTAGQAGVGDIWYDTNDQNKPYRWSGTAWQAIRDGKIQDALDAAADASNSATVALNSANGKNRVVYSTGTPNVNGTNNGDTWFRIDSSGTVLNQYRWTLPGATWTEVEPQAVTVASLDAGKITTGTLAAGVTITAGTPGGTRTELSASGFRSYVGTNLRMSFVGSSSTVVADTFRSAVYVNGGTSYVQVGDIGDGSQINGIQFIRPGNSMVTLKNISDSGGGVFEVSLRNNGNVNQGGWQFSTSGIKGMASFMTLGVLSGGSGITLGQSSLSLNGGGYSTYVGGAWVEYSGQYHTFSVNTNGSGLRLSQPGNGAYGNLFMANTYTLAGIKFTSDGAIQARTYNDGGYAYLRGILQDQSNPELKERITEINTDALAELSNVKRYAYDWVRQDTEDGPVPRDSSTGILLSEVPWSVQQTEDGYATGSYLGLLTSAVNQAVAEFRNEITGLKTRIKELEDA